MAANYTNRQGTRTVVNKFQKQITEISQSDYNFVRRSIEIYI
jgi:hypothetical protein